MRSKRVMLVVVVLLLGAILMAHLHPAPSRTSVPAVGGPSLANSGDPDATALLRALAQHGWKRAALGGFWQTWRIGPPAGVDFLANGTATPPTTVPPSDPLLELEVLDALWRNRASDPQDGILAPFQATLTLAIKRQVPFAQALDEGAIITTLLDLARVSGDAWYTTQAQIAITRDAATRYHPQVGAIYWVDDQHPQGWYLTAETLELAAALVEEGQAAGHPQWSRDGQQAVAFLQTHAYLPLYRIFLGRLGTVVLANGSANPDEEILRANLDAIPDDGGAAQTGDIAREAQALLTIGTLTHTTKLTQQAMTLLDDALPTHNHVNLWDATNGGYAQRTRFWGLSYAYAGRPLPPDPEKRPADEALLLSAYLHASQVDPGICADICAQLERIVHTQVIVGHVPGVFPAVSATWQPISLPGGGTLNWYRSAAMAEVALTLLTAHPPTGTGTPTATMGHQEAHP